MAPPLSFQASQSPGSRQLENAYQSTICDHCYILNTRNTREYASECFQALRHPLTPLRLCALQGIKNCFLHGQSRVVYFCCLNAQQLVVGFAMSKSSQGSRISDGTQKFTDRVCVLKNKIMSGEGEKQSHGPFLVILSKYGCGTLPRSHNRL